MTAEKSKMVQIQTSKDVLIIGAGAAGLEAAAGIAAQGYKAVVIGRQTVCTCAEGCCPKDKPAFAQVEIMEDVVLEDLAGVAGDFRVTLAKGSEKSEATFGAVIAAPQYKTESLSDVYKLSLGDRVVTQTQMEAMLADDAAKAKLVNGNGVTVAFLSGLAKEGDPTATERALRAALNVQQIDNCNAYIYAGNVKVGAKGLERLFTQSRHNGVVCFKPLEMPQIETGQDKIKIITKDPVIRTDIELEADYLVVDECLNVTQEDIDLAQTLRIDTDLDGLIPSNNVHRFPAKSNREGIYVANNSLDAANAALRVKELIGDGVRTVAEDIAVVDENRCVICLTCYRCCPHGAIYWKDGAAVISPAACQGCGICASECPMDAIQLGEFTDDDLRSGIKDAVASIEASPSIVAFCCKNSALEAGEAAKQFGNELPPGFRMIQVPCAGKVDVEFVMKAFVEGADGVMVAACHDGNCKAERGNTYAKWRVNEIRQRLENMGLDKNRLAFTTVASNMAKEFTIKINEFSKQL